MSESAMVKKWKIAPFINKGTKASPEWVRIKKSTAFDLSLNPEIQEYDYIADENPTSEVLKYKPSLNQSLTMYKGEADYDLIFDYFYNLKVGSDAKTEILLAFYTESETKSGKDYYKAWKSDCTISVTDLNSVDSTITFDINFGGTVAKGYIYLDDSEPDESEPTWTDSLPSA